MTTASARGSRRRLRAGALLVGGVAAALWLASAGNAAAPTRFADCRTGLGGASVGLSGAAEQLFIERGSAPACHVRVGSYPADTHYARLRWTNVDIRHGEEVWLYGTFLLPADFYAAQEGYVRLAWLENYNLDRAHPRRLGLVVYGGDNRARIVRQRQGHEETVILRLRRRLPVGQPFTLELRFRLSQADGKALSQIYLDGRRVGSTRRANLTAGAHRTARFTRVGFGLDGAAGQDTRTLELWMRALGVAPTRPS